MADRDRNAPGGAPEWETSVSGHYAALTDQMLNFGGDLLATCFGLWGPETTNDREALLRANHTLVQVTDLGITATVRQGLLSAAARHPSRRLRDQLASPSSQRVQANRDGSES